VAGRRIIRRREGAELANPLTKVAILVLAGVLFRSAVHSIEPNRKQPEFAEFRNENKSGISPNRAGGFT
jgi:hypothetical protein